MGDRKMFRCKCWYHPDVACNKYNIISIIKWYACRFTSYDDEPWDRIAYEYSISTPTIDLYWSDMTLKNNNVLGVSQSHKYPIWHLIKYGLQVTYGAHLSNKFA